MSIESTAVAGIPCRRTVSVHQRLSLDTPAALRAPEGHISLAVFPLEDWFTASPRPTHFKHLPHGYHRLLLADRGDGDPSATFAINWDQGWHPQLFAKWAAGRFYPDLLAPAQKPFALCGHFSFQRLRWYHHGFTQRDGDLRLYIDDDLVIEARDEPDSNNGPLLQRGYVALRCMLRTAMRFKNVSIRHAPLLP